MTARHGDANPALTPRQQRVMDELCLDAEIAVSAHRNLQTPEEVRQSLLLTHGADLGGDEPTDILGMFLLPTMDEAQARAGDIELKRSLRC